MAKNRFKQAKKEDAIKAIFSSDTENTLIETPSSPIEISDTVEILNNPPINIDTIQKISDNLDAPTVIKMDKLGVSI
ncbi:hypothetical protein, partial [uncultured Clostridium sp.]|uniref:hypothetical protein n=1 Tax=uncultured Clostridium sp. TaxID=59620 RepID=UPI0026219886